MSRFDNLRSVAFLSLGLEEIQVFEHELIGINLHALARYHGLICEFGHVVASVDDAVSLVEALLLVGLHLLFALSASLQVGGRTICHPAWLHGVGCLVCALSIGVCHHHASREAVAASPNRPWGTVIVSHL